MLLTLSDVELLIETVDEQISHHQQILRMQRDLPAQIATMIPEAAEFYSQLRMQQEKFERETREKIDELTLVRATLVLERMRLEQERLEKDLSSISLTDSTGK